MEVDEEGPEHIHAIVKPPNYKCEKNGTLRTQYCLHREQSEECD